MRTGVDSLLNRIAEFAPVEIEEDSPATRSQQRRSSLEQPFTARTRSAAVTHAKPQAASEPGRSRKIRSHRARTPRPHDEHRRRTGHQPYAHGRSGLRTRKARRHAELFERTAARQSERVPGKVRIQPHQFVAQRLLLESATTPQRLTSAAAGDGFFDDFSELEMDRYDDFNILSRSMAEISADVNEVLTQLEGYIGRVEGDIDEFTKLAHHLQDEFTAARMVPIGTLYSRLSRAVRDAAQSAGKQVDLDFVGNETELDNNIIQQISDPLVHLVRNSVAHGIERAEARLAAGKPEVGKVSLRAYHRGNHIYIEVEDDGGGIDYERVKQSAIERGLVSPETADRLTERDLREMLFHPGFSTAPVKTELAGRGVGLDVVRANLNALNGEVEIQSTPRRRARNSP